VLSFISYLPKLPQLSSYLAVSGRMIMNDDAESMSKKAGQIC
jgi:hypothetical protein